MNASTVSTEPAQGAPETASRGTPRMTRRRRAVMLGALVVASIAIGVSWRLAGKHPDLRVLGDSSADAVSPELPAPRLSTAKPERTTAAVAQAASSAPTPATADLPPTVAAELAQLMHARDRLLQDQQDMARRLDRIESELAEFRQRIEQRLAADTPAPRKPRTNAQPRLVARPTESVLPVQERPRVLGVDTWNGKPSVSILVGSDVRFFAEGDVVGSSYVRRADPASQRVDFVTAGSAPASAVSAPGSAR